MLEETELQSLQKFHTNKDIPFAVYLWLSDKKDIYFLFIVLYHNEDLVLFKI